jgi:hypothetical protein
MAAEPRSLVSMHRGEKGSPYPPFRLGSNLKASGIEGTRGSAPFLGSCGLHDRIHCCVLGSDRG